ncbi:ubiquitin 3 binding protein But2 C-terminal domain-containing protein [Dipodascopsis uninucleata]
MYAKVATLLASSIALLPSVLAGSCDWPVSSFSLTDADGQLGQITDGQIRTGYLGQIYDGQIRTGNGTTCLTLVPASNGTLSDIYGRPCYVTPYHQFECSAALQPTANPYGFCASNGVLTYNGSSTFYACDTGVLNQKNIYVESISSTACTEITLSIEDSYCSPSSCSASTVVSSVTVTATSVETVASTAIQTVTASAGTVTETETETATVTASAGTVTETETATVTATASAGTVTETETATVTATAGTVTETVTVTASAGTVTETVTATASAGTVVETVTASGSVGTVVETVTASGSVGTVVETVTASGSVGTVTETVTASGSVGTVYKTATAIVTETVTKVSSSDIVIPSTVYLTSTAVTTASTTVYVTESASTTEAPSTTSSVVSSTSASSCVPSTTIYPNLIIPINSESPDTAIGTGYWANLTKSGSSEQDVLLQYDVSIDYTGTCELKFMFPDNPITFPFYLEGDTTIDVYELTGQVSESDTWNSHPATGDLIGSVTLERGSDAYLTGTKCAAGSYMAYLLKCTGDCTIEYFIDYNPPPVGTVLLPCA